MVLLSLGRVTELDRCLRLYVVASNFELLIFAMRLYRYKNGLVVNEDQSLWTCSRI